MKTELYTRRKGTKKISQEISKTVIIGMACAMLMSVIAFSYFALRYVLKEKGTARVEVLEQISDVNNVNRKYMRRIMDYVYTRLYSNLITEEIDGAEIQRHIDETQMMLDSIGADATINVVIGPKQVYATQAETPESIKNLINSYWYIKHYSGKMVDSWNLRFIDPQDVNSYKLSYGRTVFNQEGKAVAVLVVNTSQDEQFKKLHQLLGVRDKVYILDRNGIVVFHTNSQIVGTWQANMEMFEKEYGFNSSAWEQKRDQSYMISNYHDPESEWTYIEEQNISDLLNNAFQLLGICLLCVVALGTVMAWISYRRIQREMGDLRYLAGRIEEMEPQALELLPIESEYQEIYVLGTAFNQMVIEVQTLIADIQKREEEKVRSEYDFLQAQLSPHFMHNTLLAIKSLISMGRLEEAGNMMSKFVELINIPTTTEISLVTLQDEIHLLENFVSIMNCRTGKEVAFCREIPDGLLHILVPRMILQPLVDNAFFHGFAEKEQDCCILIRARADGNSCEITVEDNGAGIAPGRLREIAEGEYQSTGYHHGIGIQNIKKRLNIVYGGASDIRVESEPGVFTRVTLHIDGYELPSHDVF